MDAHADGCDSTGFSHLVVNVVRIEVLSVVKTVSRCEASVMGMLGRDPERVCC